MVYSGIDPKDGDDDDHQNDNDKIGSFLFNFVCFVGLLVLRGRQTPRDGETDGFEQIQMSFSW